MKTYHATVKNGQVEINNLANFKEWCRLNEGSFIKIITGGRRKVSEALRGYYYGAIIPRLKQLEPQWKDEDEEVVHNLLKMEFNGVDIYSPFQKQKVRVSGTVMSSQATTDQALTFIERIGRWQYENYGEELPDPEQYKYLRDTVNKVDKKVDYPEHDGDTKF